MIQLPPIPTWDGLHPMVVHFPVALLLVAPLFVVVGLVAGRRGRPMLVAALILMILGTVASFVAVASGEAAGKLAERTPEINAAIERHEQLAEQTRFLFTVLTVVFAGIMLGPRLLKRELTGAPQIVLLVLFLGIYGAATIVLANTAHNGGRLVHSFGVHTLMPPEPAPAAAIVDDD